jgi:hypothetical protein
MVFRSTDPLWIVAGAALITLVAAVVHVGMGENVTLSC